MRNIYLIGMMGAGKSVTGQNLAEELSMKFLDLDDQIVTRARMTVNEIFESRGESYFRKLEKENLKSAAQGRDQIIATGGGVVLDPDNVRRMKESGWIVYLRAPVEILWSRIQHKADRPLLKVPNPKEIFGRLFYERRPLYESLYDYAVNAEEKSPRELAREIIQLLGLGSRERA